MISSRLVCTGCGTPAADFDAYPFRCSNYPADPTGDHVLTRVLARRVLESRDEARALFLSDEPNPFLKYRVLFHAYHRALEGGLTDGDYCALVRDLDAAVRAVDGRGFTVTPFDEAPEIAARLDLAAPVRVKNETGNVSGSHKARHLMGILIWLEIADRLNLDPAGPSRKKRLAIASCGNAALAAAVVARAGERRLDVFVPEDAHPAVVARLKDLGARLITCRRDGAVPGDPCWHKFQEAIIDGAIPFTVQGSANGLTLDGGRTLGYEMVSAMLAGGFAIERLFVQVGGGALAASCIQAFREAKGFGVIAALPRLHAVQTEQAFPLGRAYDRVTRRIIEMVGAGAALGAGKASRDPAARGLWIREHAPQATVNDALEFAAHNRVRFMWPWEEAPSSLATGILDDETYDWHAVVRGMLETGGWPVAVSEETLAGANALAREATGIPVDPTGSAGLAGLMKIAREPEGPAGEATTVLFTGVDRSL